MMSFSNSLLPILHQYGLVGIFGLLALGIIALPVPEESLLLLAGTLAKSQQLSTIPTWFACFLGAITGISISYIIGRTLGHFAFYRLCKKLHLSEKHIQYTQSSFKRLGASLLFFGYFIPGVRHFTGIIAGTTALAYRRFALFAYSGAFFWVHLFFGLGYFYGLDALNLFINLYHQYGIWLLIPVILLITSYLYLRKRK